MSDEVLAPTAIHHEPSSSGHVDRQSGGGADEGKKPACPSCATLEERCRTLTEDLEHMRNQVTIASYSSLDAQSEHQATADALGEARANLLRVTEEYQQAKEAWRLREEELFRQLCDERVLRVAEAEELRLALAKAEAAAASDLQTILTSPDERVAERRKETADHGTSPHCSDDDDDGAKERIVETIREQLEFAKQQHEDEIAEMNRQANALYDRLADAVTELERLRSERQLWKAKAAATVSEVAALREKLACIERQRTEESVRQSTASTQTEHLDAEFFDVQLLQDYPRSQSQSSNRAPSGGFHHIEDHEFVVSSVVQSVQNSPQQPDHRSEDEPAATVEATTSAMPSNNSQPFSENTRDKHIYQTMRPGEEDEGSAERIMNGGRALYPARDRDDTDDAFDVVEVATPKSEDRHSSSSVTPFSSMMMVEAARASSKSVTFNLSGHDDVGGPTQVKLHTQATMPASPTRPILKNPPSALNVPPLAAARDIDDITDSPRQAVRQIDEEKKIAANKPVPRSQGEPSRAAEQEKAPPPVKVAARGCCS